jgi:eukaryotic-like serine/threonine-protein kinase
MQDQKLTLFAELKQRRVFRVAAVYAVAAIAVAEAADIMLPRLALPEWTVTLVVALCVLGFPLAVALAWAFDITPTGVRRARTGEGDSQRGAGYGWATVRIVAVGGVVVLAGAAGGWLLSRDGAAPDPDSEAVAVLPFRVAGADPTLAYLREGLVDLLSAKLTGHVGPRAVDTRTTLSVWRAAVSSGEEDLPLPRALELARVLGAGKLLVGEVVGSPGALVLRAELRDIATGRTRQAEAAGSVEDLTSLVDRLAVELLALEAGEGARLAQLTTTSLPALRAYLEGMAMYRRARFEEAAGALGQAVQIDSTFALAALRWYSAESWLTGRGESRARALALAWRHQERLSPVDRLILRAEAGARYPGFTPRAEQLEAVEAALRSAAESPELWHLYGDHLFHDGAMLGIEDWAQRAVQAFQRARELGPELPDSDIHLRDMAASLRDTTLLRQVGTEILARDSVGQKADETVWIMAMLLDDPALEARERRRRDSLNVGTVWAVMRLASAARVGVDEAMDAAERLERRSVTRPDRQAAMTIQTFMGLNAGWRGRVDAQMDREARLREQPPRVSYAEEEVLQLYVWAGVAWDGDTARAARAATRLRELVEESMAAYAPDRPVHPFYLGTLAVWDALRDDTASMSRWISQLARQAREADHPAWVPRTSEAAGPALRALRAHRAGAPETRELTLAADAFLRAGPDHQGRSVQMGNWILARLHEDQGDPVRALAAYRRVEDPQAPNLLPEVLREQGRLAEMTGDTAWAIRSYRDYLALRPSPDPEVAHHDERVRRALARLTAEGAP